jgi:hypothetical protein
MLAIKNLTQAKRLYSALRKKYFKDAVAPFHVPPKAEDLEWDILPTNADCMAETQFDETGRPVKIRVSEWLMRSYTITRAVLLHELTHMRLGSKYDCGAWSADNWKGARIARGSAWHKEALRLTALGALHL